MTRTTGYVTVGTGCRIEWFTDTRSRLVWVVAGDDRRVVEPLGVAMQRMLVGDDAKGVGYVDVDETKLWTVRGTVEVTPERLWRLEAFALLMGERRVRQ